MFLAWINTIMHSNIYIQGQMYTREVLKTDNDSLFTFV